MTDTYNSSGNWVAPAGVTEVTVEAWGGGGAGGNNSGNTAGAGGGGGAYASATFPVTPGNSYTITVGAGGNYTVGGGDGGLSQFANGAQVRAAGGEGGGNGNNGGAGGTVGASVGTTRHAGCDGGGGASTGNPNGRRGGGGGGSATSAGACSDGANGTSGGGGQGGSGAGGGGNGGSGATTNGQSGSAPGGGGGGRRGAGGAGRVTISYIAPPEHYYSRNDGSWTGTGRWSLFGCGGASAGTAEPAEGDHVTICNGDTIQLDTSNFGTGLLSLTINAGGELQMASSNASRTLTVAGDVVNNGDLHIPTNRNTTSNLVIAGNLVNGGQIEFAADGNSRTDVQFTGATATISGNGGIDFAQVAAGGNLVIDKSAGTVDMDEPLAVAGSLALLNGTLSLDAVTTVGGNFINDGTLAAGTGTFTFNGSSTQSLSGAVGTTQFNNVVLNNANGLILLDSHVAAVAGTLTLTNGRIVTGDGVVHVQNASAIAGVDTDSFVVGNLRKRFGTGTNVDVLFEVGTEVGGVLYSGVAVRLGNVSVPGDFTVSATAGDHPAIVGSPVDPDASINRWWSLSNDSVTFTSNNSTGAWFMFNDPADYDAGADSTAFVIAHRSGGAWDEITPAVNQATGSIFAGDYTMATLPGEYAIGEPNPVQGDVIVTMVGTNDDIIAGSVFLSGTVTGPPQASATNANTGTNAITTGLSTLTPGAWLFDVAGSGNAGSFAAGVGQVQRWNVSGTSSTGAGSTKPAIAVGAHTATQTHTNGNRLAHAVVAVAPDIPSSIAFDSAGSGVASATNALGWAHALQVDAIGKLLVGVAVEHPTCGGNEHVESVAYQGTPLSFVTAVETPGAGICERVEIWYLDFAEPPVPLICITDAFTGPNNSSPGGDWTTSSTAGGFGAPRIFNNRLRLTDASGNVATLATLNRLFPGAGNRIEVEFEHFAYGGTGADGIAVVLSDASIPAVAGGYGGSLGYAQNTAASPSAPGFAGGWIGVGIDEYGNFSHEDEGREGGTGAIEPDAVTIRGSGSGFSGYEYHTHVSSLSPVIDNNGGASPPHRYRVIIDHANAVNAWVSVERDTGSGYQMLIPPYDAKAESGQAEVPVEWTLSFTGSTGGSNNIHEIDTLRICASAQIATPIARWYFDEDTWDGTAGEVLDASGGGMNGTAVNGAVNSFNGSAIPGDPGTCKFGEFDGVNDYIQVTGLSDILTSSASLAFWIRTTQTGTTSAWSSPGVAGVEVEGDTDDIFWGWIDDNGHIGITVGDANGTKSTIPINDGTWHHVALTRDHDDGEYQIFIDGVLNASGPIATGVIGNGFNSFGRIENGEYFQGDLDEIWIYEGAIDTDTVVALMNNTRHCDFPTHFAVDHDGAAVNCEPEPVTITAHDGGHGVMSGYGGLIEVSTSTGRGDFTAPGAAGSLTPGAPDSGYATYQFAPGDGGSVTLFLRNTHVETVSIDVTDGAGAEDPTEDPPLTFDATGFRFDTIPTQIAGKPSDTGFGGQALALHAIRTNDETGACEVALQGPTNVELAFECLEPAACAGQFVSINGDAVGVNPTFADIALDFGDDTQSWAPIVIAYPDVGQLRLHARHELPLEDASGSTNFMLGSSNAFVVRPFAIHVSAQGNPGAAGPGGALFTSAGSDFGIEVRAVVWQAGDDLDNDGIADGHDDADPTNNANLADNATTPNFGNEGAAFVVSSALVAPAGGANPALGGSPVIGALAAGAGSSTVSFSEVGIIELHAATTSGSYLGTANGLIAGASGRVGRFYPHHFDTQVSPACGAYTYSGQPFTVTATARNLAGATTANYDGPGGFAKSTTFSNAGATSGFSNNTAVGADYVAGVVEVNDIAYTFASAETLPSDITLRAVDDDGASSAGHGEATTGIRSGRLRVANANGSELLPLSLPVTVESWMDFGGGVVGWGTASSDSCTAVGPADTSAGNYQGALGSVTVGGVGPLASGEGAIDLEAPGATGSADLTIDLDDMPWLRFDWLGDGAADPVGRASFGIYDGSPRRIYLREIY